MALRYHHTSKRSESKMLTICLRVSAIIAFLLSVIVILCLVLINGNSIKATVENTLGKITDSQVTIETAEFSPLYPDTIKLNNVLLKQENNSYKIAECYVEVALIDSIFNNTLFFDDLYLRGINFTPDFFLQAADHLPKSSLYFKTFRLDDWSLDLPQITTKSSSLRLQEVTFANDKLKFQNGSVILNEGQILNLPYHQLAFNFKEQDLLKFNLQDLQGRLLGGNLTGEATLDLNNKTLDFTNLNLAKTILRTQNLKTLPFKITAKQGNLSDIFYTTLNDELILSGINGQFENLSFAENGLLYTNFQGQIDEISKPQEEIILTYNQGEIINTKDKLNFKLQGNFQDGEYKLTSSVNFKDKRLIIDNLELKQNKLELKDAVLKLFSQKLNDWQVILNQSQIQDIEVLSYINTLPISAEKLSIKASELSIKENKIKGLNTGLINLNVQNFLYSDLLLRKITLMGTLSDNLITISAPQITFKDSDLSFSATLANNQTAQSYFLLWAHDFDLGNLNSNLFPHLFAGKLTAEISLSAEGGDFTTLKNTLEGQATFNAQALLVSKFGLDLINGGKKNNLTLSLSEFLSALEAQDCGIYDLNLNLNLQNQRARLAGNFDLPVSHVFVNQALDLNKFTLDGLSTFTSHSKDSITTLEITGDLKDPLIKLNAKKRGELRPGLFIQNLNANQEEQKDKQISQVYTTKSQQTKAQKKSTYEPKLLTSADLLVVKAVGSLFKTSGQTLDKKHDFKQNQEVLYPIKGVGKSNLPTAEPIKFTPLLK